MTTPDYSKATRTRDGRKAEVVWTDMGTHYPLGGRVLESNGWVVATWGKDGRCFDGLEKHPLDLMLEPEIVECWLNVYSVCSSSSHTTKAYADDAAGPRRLHCIHLKIDKHTGKVIP